MICITLSSPETSHMQYTRLPPPIYQYVVNLVVSLTIGGDPGVFMNVPVREHRVLNNQIFRCGKVCYSNSIIVTILIEAMYLLHYEHTTLHLDTSES